MGLRFKFPLDPGLQSLWIIYLEYWWPLVASISNLDYLKNYLSRWVIVAATPNVADTGPLDLQLRLGLGYVMSQREEERCPRRWNIMSQDVKNSDTFPVLDSLGFYILDHFTNLTYHGFSKPALFLSRFGNPTDDFPASNFYTMARLKLGLLWILDILEFMRFIMGFHQHF